MYRVFQGSKFFGDSIPRAALRLPQAAYVPGFQPEEIEGYTENIVPLTT